MLCPRLIAPALRPALLHRAPLPALLHRAPLPAAPRHLHTSPALHKIVAGKYKVGQMFMVVGAMLILGVGGYVAEQFLCVKWCCPWRWRPCQPCSR